MAQPVRPPSPAATAKKVADLLLAERVVTAVQHAALLEQAAQRGERAEDLAVELGLATEADVLKALAVRYQTNFISTEKLAKAEIPKGVLDMVPRRLAETSSLAPVRFDAQSATLYVLTASPDDRDALRDVQLASGAREVKAVLCRPAAVRAVVAKVYAGDASAFAALEQPGRPESQPPPTFQRGAEPSNVRAALAPPSQRASVPMDSFLELVNVMVNLLEGTRPELRGHSGHVGRLARQLAERMGLDAASTASVVIAAYVHDLGKMGQFHLTPLNCGEYEGHKSAAQRAFRTPTRLLEPVKIGDDALRAVSAMYERYDGKGFPDGLREKEIPVLARIVAICDTYADLTLNARNPYRKQLGASEACGVLAKYKGAIFDPNLVDLFRLVVLGEDLRARLLQNRYTALLVEGDPEETTVVELRMIEQGFVVKTARTAEQALKLLAAGDVDLVMSELDLEDADGLTLLAEARKAPWGKDLPWVIYTRRQEKAEAQRAFELGVLDFVAKPAQAEVLVAKMKALLDQRAAPKARGVAGSLKEMGLPDMIQVLFNGKKTGSLEIRARDRSGHIHLLDGQVVNALWGDLRAEQAFFAMVKLTDGDFALDPSFKPTARAIHQSVDALLLEAMRRIDEGA